MLHLQGREMRLGKVDRVKRQLLTEAVADNLDTIRGLPPRSLRPTRRSVRVWVKRASLLIVPLALVLGSRGIEVSGSRGPAVTRAQIVQPPTARLRDRETPQPQSPLVP